MVAQFVSFFLALAILRETSMEMDVMKTFNVTMNFAVEPLANIISRLRFSKKLFILLYEQLLIFGCIWRILNHSFYYYYYYYLFIVFYIFIFIYLLLVWVRRKVTYLGFCSCFFFFFFYAVTMLTFQIKKTISSEKWFNYVVTFFLKMLKIWVDRTMLNGEKKEDGLR